MSNELLTELTDVALRIKEAFEDKNLDGFTALFTKDARINSMGRFYTLEAFVRRLSELLPYIEQQSLDITHIEDSQINEKSAFVTYVVEVSWVNPKTWEEGSQRGAMSLELYREPDGWFIHGFTFSPRQAGGKVPDEGDVRPPAGGEMPPPRFFGLDGLFSFWY